MIADSEPLTIISTAYEGHDPMAGGYVETNEPEEDW